MNKNPDFLLIPYIIVSCDKLQLPDKFIYGTIYWLAKLKNEKCFASNKTLAEISQCSSGSVANGLKRLEDCGFIKRVFTNSSKKEREEIIPLVGFGLDSLYKEEGITGGGIDDSLVEEQKNKTIIIKDNNISIEEPPLLSELEHPDWQLPEIYGKTPQSRIIKFYSLLWEKTYGNVYRIDNFKKVGAIIKSLLKLYAEYQIAHLLVAFFKWRGANGNEEKEYKYVYNAFFPWGLFKSNVLKYETFVKNWNTNIKFDNPEHNKKAVEFCLDEMGIKVV